MWSQANSVGQEFADGDEAKGGTPRAGDAGAGVKSALRVLTILEYFATTLRPATLTQISRQLGLPKSSCLGLLETLRQSGYLYWLGKDAGYYPTRRWRDLGEAVTTRDPILSLAAPVLAAIRDTTQETAVLAKLEGDVVLYLDVAEPARVLRFSAYPGERKAIHSAASGRALLGLLPVGQRLQRIRRLDRQRFSVSTPVEIDEIAQAIEDGNARGWHISIAEHQPETAAIAVAFQHGAEAYAWVVGAPTHRVLDRLDDIGALLSEYAQQVQDANRQAFMGVRRQRALEQA